MSDSADGRMRAGSPADRKTTYTQTQARIGSAGGGALTLSYIIACWDAHKILVPNFEQATGILIACGPFIHKLGQVVMYWTGRLIPKNANFEGDI